MLALLAWVPQVDSSVDYQKVVEWYFNLMVYYLVEHDNLALYSPVLKWLPFQIIQHICNISGVLQKHVGIFSATSQLGLVDREATMVTRYWPGKILVFIGIFAVTSRLELVGREATTVTPLWPVKSIVFTIIRVRNLPELIFSSLIKIQEIYSDTLKEDIFINNTL